MGCVRADLDRRLRHVRHPNLIDPVVRPGRACVHVAHGCLGTHPNQNDVNVKGAAICHSKLVGERGFEPPTSASRTLRAAGLRHSPISLVAYTGLRPICNEPDPAIPSSRHAHGCNHRSIVGRGVRLVVRTRPVENCNGVVACNYLTSKLMLVTTVGQRMPGPLIHTIHPILW